MYDYLRAKIPDMKRMEGRQGGRGTLEWVVDATLCDYCRFRIRIEACRTQQKRSVWTRRCTLYLIHQAPRPRMQQQLLFNCSLVSQWTEAFWSSNRLHMSKSNALVELLPTGSDALTAPLLRSLSHVKHNPLRGNNLLMCQRRPRHRFAINLQTPHIKTFHGAGRGDGKRVLLSADATGRRASGKAYADFLEEGRTDDVLVTGRVERIEAQRAEDVPGGHLAQV